MTPDESEDGQPVLPDERSQTSQNDSDLLRLLVSNVQDHSIYIIGADGRIATWNAGACRMKGYTAQDIIGQPYERFFTAEDRLAGKPQRLLREAQRRGFIHDQGWRVRKDGTRFWASATVTVLYDEQTGSLRGYGKVTYDETAEHVATELLRQSEERFRLAIGALRDQAFFTLSPEGLIENWNPGAQLIKGYAESEVVGRHFEIFFTEEDRAAGKPQRELERAKRDGSYEEEGWRVRKDGSRFWAAVVVTAVFDSEGRLRGFTKVTRNETERHEAHVALNDALTRARIAEQELRRHAETLEERVTERTRQLTQQAEELTRINAELEQFAYIASHDLKEPLRLITSYLDLARTRFPNLFLPPGGVYLGRVETAAMRMSEMVEAVLEYSHTSSAVLGTDPVPLNEALAQAMENLQPHITAAKAKVHASDLPLVRGSLPQLARVFQNLLSNAIKFRTEHTPEIFVDARLTGSEWMIGVRDNGIGIDPAFHEKIFRIFQRLHARTEYAGTGIGLAACRKIIERHGGRIWVESMPGKGSTFTFTLPRSTAGSP
jgi:PAS domain S-box-containing protein